MCPYVARYALGIFPAEGPLAFDVQNDFSGRLAGLLVGLAVVAGERSNGGVLARIEILREFDRLNMLVGRDGGGFVHRLARIPST